MININNNSSIAVLDSGIGGLSVLYELTKLMPNENFIYFGDTKEAPYGTKTKEEVKNITIKNINYLLSLDVKEIVIACNTATSAAIATLRKDNPSLLIVGLEPAIKPAATSLNAPVILSLATELTINEEKYKNLVDQYKDIATIISVPVPNLVKYVENCQLDTKDLKEYLSSTIKPYINGLKIDGVVLGCTHFPFAKKTIKSLFKKEIKIFDGGYGAAKETKRLLEVNNLLTTSIKPGKTTYIASDNDMTFEKKCIKMLEILTKEQTL